MKAEHSRLIHRKLADNFRCFLSPVSTFLGTAGIFGTETLRCTTMQEI